MKKLSIYLTMSVMAVLAVACSKNGSQVDPVKPEVPKEANIGFGSASAKAPDALVKDENKPLQVHVYDYYTAASAEEIVYINDLIQESTTEGAWVFVNDPDREYAWKKGAHKFLGWVAVDEAGTEVPNLNYADKVLTVGTAAAPVAAADYRYAEIVNVNWPDNTMIGTDASGKSVAKPVSLNVKHLTSALTFTVSDFCYTGDVLVNSISIGDVKTKGSATIDYSGDAQTVAYSLGDETGAIAFPLPDVTPFTREGDEGPFVYDGETVCVWPQEYEGLKMTVKYTAGGSQKTATVDIPDGEWEAGMVYNFNIQIVNKNIVLTFVVQDWEVVEIDPIDTSTGSINMSNVTWMNTKFDLNGNGIYGEYITETYIDPADGKSKTRVLLDENTVQMSAYRVMMFPTEGSFDHVVYETYEEDVIDEETGEVIHKAGEIKTYEEDVIDDDGETIIHHAGDPIVKNVEEIEYAYQPAQGYFTVNYPVKGLYKIEMIPAYGETEVDPSQYVILIYDSATSSWRNYNTAGEPIVHDTVYFRIIAADGQDGTEHKAQIDIWFKPDGSDDWISAYSEIRANYAVTIPANS